VLFGRRCVAPILLDLAQRYPALELDLSFGDPITDLAEGGHDLAIRTGDLEDKAGVIARRVARQRMVVCASPAYLERHGMPRRLEELGNHHAIIYRRSGRIRPWLFPRDGQRPIEIMPAGRLRLDDLDAIAEAAASGMGLAWLPCWLIRERIRTGALVRVLPDQPEFLYDGYALWPQTPHLAPKVRVAVDALAAALPRLMA
jgi:DNA-binding transcriptional LysR family regulator